MKAIPPKRKIFFDAIWMLSIYFLSAIRFWSQRHRERTRALNLADFSIGLSVFILSLIVWTFVWESVEQVQYYEHPEGKLHPVLRPILHKVHFVMVFGYFTSLYAVKFAFLSWYHDLFPRMTGRIRLVLKTAVAWTVCTYSTSILLHLSYCHPISNAWAIGPANCNSQRDKWPLTLCTYLNVATDIMIILLPISVIRTLQLRGRTLVAVSFIFILGLLSIAVALTRWGVVLQTYTEKTDSLDRAINDIMVVMTWCEIECWICQIAFFLPSLRVFLRSKEKPVPSSFQKGSNMNNTIGSGPRKLWNSKGSSKNKSDIELTALTVSED